MNAAPSQPPPPTAGDPLVQDDAVAEEPASWVWTYDWFQAVEWDGGVELGLSGSDGNSEAMSLRTGFNLKRKTDMDETKVDWTYLKANASGIESQHNSIFNAGYERFLGKSPWTYFLKSNVEYDEFKAFDLRLVFNGGFGYHWLRTDAIKLKTRVGAGVSHEINGPDDDWEPEAVLGLDYEWKISDRQKFSSTIDYFPQWSDFNDFRLVSDLGWEVLLDEAANLSLKFSLKDRYDSTPNGRRPNDVDYAVLLLWKL
jgi:putative salt-induced outer membrane protein YdiY